MNLTSVIVILLTYKQRLGSKEGYKNGKRGTEPLRKLLPTPYIGVGWLQHPCHKILLLAE